MTPRVTLFFEPLDVLQFRNHKPFNAGYQSVAESVFPMPSVFLGCLRTILLRRQGARFGGVDFELGDAWAQRLLGSPSTAGTLALRGPLLARTAGSSIEPLFPAPFDLISTRSGHRVSYPAKPAARRLHWTGKELERTERAISWTESDSPKSDGGLLLTLAGARRYLDTTDGGPLELDRGDTTSIDEIYRLETRVGIARDDRSLSADEGMLYTLRPFRLAPGAGFAVDVELPGGEADVAIRKLDGAVVPLGGKTHLARIRCVDGPIFPDELTPESMLASPAKLWLVTPLVLGGGSWPAEIACATTSRTDPIGGYDMAARAPKPLRRALPAGTALVVNGMPPGDALARLGGAGWNDDRCAGYGTALAGKGSVD